jgi:hypothetical protein
MGWALLMTLSSLEEENELFCGIQRRASHIHANAFGNLWLVSKSGK